ncbi:dihydrofolate reductase family protein [Jatrophihabitans sp.]|uniref:dihydrofolate reductase family protein n=1 Tax=Jatrophihabitans sp. TaxID=1932789 RepID=UPI002CD1C288|nr:dihydrofolate reductase family protein [Jatrophihabitans sp.]
MGKVIAGMTMSLDGYIDAGALNPDFLELMAAPSFQEMTDNTGAIVMGRNVYDMADPFLWVNDDYEYQVPLVILTHNPPEKYPEGNGKISVQFATDVESAISQATAAAGDKVVQVIGGASTIQQCLNSGLCDELQIDLVPILLGKGLRLLENIDTDKVVLERISVLETTSLRTSITFKVSQANQ